MNKSKRADDQRIIHEFMDRIKYAFQALDFELGGGVPNLVKHDGYTWSTKVFGKTIILKFEIKNE